MNLKRTKLHWAVALALPLYAHAANAVVIDSELMARGNAGDVAAQREIGEQLLHGDGTPQNIPDAFHWLLLASQKGDSVADTLIADFYIGNAVDEKAYRIAIERLKKAAYSGNLQGADRFAQAMVEHALRSTTSKSQADEEFATAIPFLRSSANRKNINSCWYMGYLSFTGKGVPHSAADATRYMRCAADGGHALASFWVAGEILAAQPKAGTPAIEEARRYLRAAADRGHQGAAELLATLPTAPAVDKPKILVAKADVKTEAPAFGPITLQMPRVATPMLITTNVDMRPGSKLAPVVIADTSSIAPAPTIDAPIPVVKSAQELQVELDTANQRIRMMQEQLDLVRQTQTEELQGEALNRQALTALKQGDYATALDKLRQAIALGDVPATANLGLMYLQGSGVEHNPKLAIELLTRAAERGNRTACENLGAVYEEGYGIPRDVKLAVQWYRRAQVLGSVRALPALHRIGAAS